MNDLELSVILPVYNAKKTIKRCIDSIIFQKKVLFELIIIDDFSTDETIEILNDYKKYKNINIIKNKINKGVSYNRNLGIKKAKGKYICFIDADDTYIEDSLYTMINEIKKFKTNMVKFCFNFKYEDKIKKFNNENYFGLLNDNSKYMKDLFTNKFQGYVWNYIFDSKIIKKYKFNEKIGMMEDIIFIQELLLNNCSISFSNKYTYNYFYYDDSASNSLKKSSRNINNILYIKKKIYDIKFNDYKSYYMYGIKNALSENIFKMIISNELNKKKYVIENSNEMKLILKEKNIDKIRYDRYIIIALFSYRLYYCLLFFCKFKQITKKVKYGINKKNIKETK